MLQSLKQPFFRQLVLMRLNYEERETDWGKENNGLSCHPKLSSCCYVSVFRVFLLVLAGLCILYPNDAMLY